jgi:type IV secretory pathway VirB10-like protein
LMALAASMLPAPELASVHGGNTITGQASAIEVGGRSSRWALGVLGVAALIGAIAAVFIGTSKRDDDIAVPMPTQPDPTPAPPLTNLTQPAPPPPVVVAPPPPPTNTVVEKVAEKTEKSADEGSGESLESKIAARRIAQAKLAASPTNKTPAASHKGADATVQVDERDGEYANITLNGQSHDTPGAKFTLAPGTYTLIVRNDSEKFTCQVRLDPGRVVRMHVSLERHTCND